MTACLAVEIESVEIGFGGCWKLGHWTPVRIRTSEPVNSPATLWQVIAPDGDGVLTVTEQPVVSGGETSSAELVTRIGRPSSVTARLVAGSKLVAEQTTPILPPSSRPRRSLASTETLVVRVGAQRHEIAGLAEPGAITATVPSPADLPTDWIAYEAVDLLVIESLSADAWHGLTASSPQVIALTRWVQAGGHLLLSLGEEAEALVGADGPLAGLAPGRLRRVVTLPDLVSLERYAEADAPLNGRLRVAQLESVAGVIETHGPGRATDLPLAIRTPHGLGEVVTLAFDLDGELLATWPGRKTLLERLRSEPVASRPVKLDSSGQIRRSSRELAVAMRGGLGAAIDGVGVTPFLAIVAATLVYLLIIGPGDYFLVKRVLRRVGFTWVSYPLVVAAASAAVIGYGATQRGDQVTVNQIELVDVDVATGATHGALWAEFYSPTSERHSIAIETRGLTDGVLNSDARLGWFGAPGAGLTGMQSTSDSLATRSTYLLDLETIVGMASNTASTKSLTARWVARLPSLLPTDLTASDSGLVEGSLMNETGANLLNVRLFYGEWAWRLGSLSDGQVIVIDESLAPVKITSLLKSELGGTVGLRTARPIDVESQDATGLLKLMMFFRHAGWKIVDRELHYQRFVDLSHQLTIGQAVMLAELKGPVSQLVNDQTGEPFATSTDQAKVFYRFVLPVAAQ